MKFTVNIRKTHVLAILSVIVLIGVVLAYGGNNPQVMGHSFGELNGTAPNCIEVSGSAPCLTLKSQTAWTPKDVVSWSAESWNTNRLGGYGLSSFCRSDGTNCLLNIYKFPGDRLCQNSAFLCGFNAVGSFPSTPKPNPAFIWTDQNDDPCDWVLCTLP